MAHYTAHTRDSGDRWYTPSVLPRQSHVLSAPVVVADQASNVLTARWYFNDTVCLASDASRVRSPHAYLLCYRRR